MRRVELQAAALPPPPTYHARREQDAIRAIAEQRAETLVEQVGDLIIQIFEIYLVQFWLTRA